MGPTDDVADTSTCREQAKYTCTSKFGACGNRSQLPDGGRLGGHVGPSKKTDRRANTIKAGREVESPRWRRRMESFVKSFIPSNAVNVALEVDW